MNALSRELLETIWQAAGDDEAGAERLAQAHRTGQKRSHEIAERIRARASYPVCKCMGPLLGERGAGRCTRCWGWPSEEQAA